MLTEVYPGGLGARNMESYARGMGIENVTYDDSKRIRKLWLESYPEMKLHLNPPVDEYWTARNIKEWCNKNNINLSGEYTQEALQNELWRQWNRSKKEFDTEEDFTEFKKKLGRKIFFIIKDLVRYKAKTISDRIRANCTYSSACNTIFQGLTSDGFKLAMWYLLLSDYKIVNVIHDEIIIELNDDEHLSKHVERCENLMIKAMKWFVKKTRVSLESSLMYTWYKEADPIYDDKGVLMIWEPDEEDKDGYEEIEEMSFEEANPELF